LETACPPRSTLVIINLFISDLVYLTFN
jgi:hypothetical protein